MKVMLIFNSIDSDDIAVIDCSNCDAILLIVGGGGNVEIMVSVMLMR